MGIFAALALPLLAASAAYACQRLVTLHANPQSAAAGTAVQVSGVNYNSAGTSSNVDIRLDGRNGPVLASIAPASLGSKGDFSVSVTIPAGTASGNHIFVATQILANGAPCAGCPGRANIEVTGASASSADNNSAAGPAASNEDQASGAPASDTSPAPQPASEPAASQPASQPTTASQANQPAAQPSAPAATDAAQPVATASAQPATAAKPSGGAPAAPAAAPVEAAPALAASDAPVAPEATATAAVETAPVAPASGPVALLPAAAGERPSPVPGLALVSALALVLLGVGAFWKSRMTLFGDGNFTPAAG